jgi:alpha-1,3-mannosyl-glycoprotein beta-1,2-N-acetylglucosaminyltransferase
MQLAPDFFEYFAAMAPVLDADPARLWCASSWSDHGQAKFVGDPSAVYRSDFFPGLGWMLTSATWDTLTSSWPTAFWDDWMRMNATRKGRQCVRPEMCRIYNIGRLGASRGQFYDQYLAPVAMNTQFVPWTAHNLSFLADAEQYESFMAALVGAASPIDSATAALRVASAVTEDDPPGADLVYAYANGPQYTAFAAGLGLMKDLKDGQPRGSYKGVVTVRLHGTTRLFIAPAAYVEQARRELRTQVQKEHPPGEAESSDHAPVVVGGEPGAGQL